MISMRQYTGKNLVALLRGKNYAHAGEEEAISMVMNHFPKNKDQTILDVGCGLGETSAFIQNNGWGLVTGFDIEEESIDYAQKTYPKIKFFISDVNTVHTLTLDRFNISCVFNSFYSFCEQEKALIALNSVTKTQGSLAIFDYLDLCNNKINPSINKHGPTPFIPVNLNTIEKMLLKTGWKLTETVIISKEYEKWYDYLIRALYDNKQKVIRKFGEDAYVTAHYKYKRLLDAIIDKTLGGVIVYAQKLE